LLLVVAGLMAGCSAPEATGVKVIVGARMDGPPVVEYAVVVIAEGKFRAVGPQATTPVPKGAEIIGGLGKVIEGSLEAGKPADLVLRNAATGSVESTMKNGEWVK
jgi:imidazolonepropionase-like amidohydrolase